MTGLDLSVEEERSRSFEPCLNSIIGPYYRISAHRRGPNISSPVMTANMALTNTAPAATSLAAFARGWDSDENRAIQSSKTVLNISATNTTVITTKMMANSTL